MTNYQFRPATRDHVFVLVGLAGGTGSGKTMSAMRLAQGMVGRDKKFAVIDTERGRARHYAPLPGAEPDFENTFRFDYIELNEPFTPEAYEGAIAAAEAGGYEVCVVDSMSHEHAGDGGLLDMQEAELNRMAGDDYSKRESCKMASWIKPKKSHKRMMSKLLQCRMHLILCFRAESKIEMVKEGGKMKVQPKESLVGYKGWIPVSEKTLPFELTVSFMMIAENPGQPHPIKLQEQHKALFPLDKLIDEQCGRRLAAWAAGGGDTMGTVYASFAAMGVSRDALAKHLGHTPTEADIPALRAYKESLKAARKPKPAVASSAQAEDSF